MIGVRDPASAPLRRAGARVLGGLLVLAAAVAAASVPAAAGQGGAELSSRDGGSGASMGGGDAASASALGFEPSKTRIVPKHPLFDGRRPIRLHYGFKARRRVNLRIRVVQVRSGNTVRVWRVRGAEPGKRMVRRWNGLNRRGRAVGDGRYEFRFGPRGRRDRFAGRLRIHGHVFPVDGRHSDRGPVGEFGADRSGGRTHEGYDILAACGTRLRAARGGRVRRVGYDDRLYGHFVLIAGRKTNERYFYAHLRSPSGLRRGERVRTGQRVGAVGRTGNARTTPCHLHFELRRGRGPIDPERKLRRWDRWS